MKAISGETIRVTLSTSRGEYVCLEIETFDERAKVVQLTGVQARLLAKALKKADALTWFAAADKP